VLLDDAIELTRHAAARLRQRALDPEAIAFVAAYGVRLQRTGVTFVMLRECDIPDGADRLFGERLIGTVLLVGADDTVITAYRNSRAWREIRRKTKYQHSWRNDRHRSTGSGEATA